MREQRISHLLDEVAKWADSPRNQKLGMLWQAQPEVIRDSWRGTPRAVGSERFVGIPISVEPEKTMWGKILGFSMRDFYTNPEMYLRYTLEIALYKFKELKDDVPLEKNIEIWLGSSFETSLFGLETVYLPDRSPWIGKHPIIKREEDLGSLDYPDFYESGLMPLAMEFYERISQLIPDDFIVSFPCWIKGPFGTAVHLRGMQNLLVDMIVRPDFVHKLMRFVTHSRKRWVRERASFLGTEVGVGDFDNDEVGCPILSPRRYEEFVLPYEKELCEFHGGISYWHSCQDITPLLPSIKKIARIGMLHVGPWTNLPAVMKIFEHTVPLEICVHPVKDVLMATEAQMRSKITEIIKNCGGGAYTVRAEGLDTIRTLEYDLEKIHEWVRIARRLTRVSGR